MAEPAESKNDKNSTEIIIIGAGIGGLSAANTLLRNGIVNFKILEAQDRIGGRIKTSETGSKKLEMGANYIHGILGNPIYEIALKHGLVDITHAPRAHNVVAAMEDGRQVPFSVLQEIYEAYICFLKRCEEYFLSQYLPPDGVLSVGDHINLEAALYLDKVTDQKEKHVKQLIFDCLLKRETCITGCNDMKEVDLMELGSFVELQGGNIVLPSGMSSIIGSIASDIPPENIILNHAVCSINWMGPDYVSDKLHCSGYDSGIDLLANSDVNNDSDSDKTVTGGTPTPRRSSTSNKCGPDKVFKDENQFETFSESVSEKLSELCEERDANAVEIICENGAKFTANHVICTIPLGVLKEKAATLFSPKLPKEKSDSIKKLSFGTVDKIYLEYSRPFLNASVSEIMLLWNCDDSDSESSVEATWFKKIYSFTKVTETLILGWISGKEARYMETLPDNVVGEKCTEILRKFLNDPYIPMPKFCTCSRWKSNEFIRGSYTSIAVGAAQADVQRVAQPLCYNNKPVVLFAGEHTHNSYYSTAHGAFLSGEVAVQTLLKKGEENEVDEEVKKEEEENGDDDTVEKEEKGEKHN